MPDPQSVSLNIFKTARKTKNAPLCPRNVKDLLVELVRDEM